VLHIPRLLRDSVRAQLLENRAEFLEHEPGTPLSEFYKTTPPFFHDVWVGSILAPSVPELRKTDGESLLLTEVNYEVLDRNALKSSLDTCPSLDAEASSEGQVSWRWAGENPRGEGGVARQADTARRNPRARGQTPKNAPSVAPISWSPWRGAPSVTARLRMRI